MTLFLSIPHKESILDSMGKLWGNQRKLVREDKNPYSSADYIGGRFVQVI